MLFYFVYFYFFSALDSFLFFFFFFFFKQKTAYEMRISDWSSDVCSSDLLLDANDPATMSRPDAPDPTAWCIHGALHRRVAHARCVMQIGRASCRERVCQYV